MSNPSRLAAALWIAMISLGMISGCGQSQPASPGDGAVPAAAPPKAPNAESVKDAEDYFPHAVGARWVYRVELPGRASPITHHEIIWPTGPTSYTCSALRGIVLGEPDQANQDGPAPPEPRIRSLVLTVRAPAARQGRLEYPRGVELAIERDEARLFHEANQLYWAIRGTGFVVRLVQTFSADSAAAGPERDAQEGSADRVIYFADPPEPDAAPEGSSDRLVFVGLEPDVPGAGGTPCRHFRRSVAARPSPPSPTDRRLALAFVEDTWFARGRGLVRLVQTVEGKPSMVWTLASFSAGR